MKNKQIIAASHLIADIDPALGAVWLEQPFRRHDIVTAFHQSLSNTSAYKHLADGIAVTLRSAIDSTKPCTCHEIYLLPTTTAYCRLNIMKIDRTLPAPVEIDTQRLKDMHPNELIYALHAHGLVSGERHAAANWIAKDRAGAERAILEKLEREVK